MRVETTGEITPGFFVTGHPGVPVYLLDGPQPALFDAGFTALSPLYLRDIRTILGNRAPAILFLTHSHFDHIGAVGFFKEVWPDLRVAASARVQAVLQRPNALNLIRKLNAGAARALKTWGVDGYTEEPFRPFEIDVILSPGDSMPLAGGLTVECLETPGHTWDFFSYWIPEKKILIASEAVGVADQSGYIVSEFLVDFDAYRESLARLALMPVSTLCPGHKAVMTGPDCAAHMNSSLDHADRYAAMVGKILLAEDGDIERTVARVKSIEYDSKPLPKQPEPAYLLNTQARVKTLWSRMIRNGEAAPLSRAEAPKGC